MAGHLGNETVTVQKIKVVKVDSEKNLILINGAIPGVNGNLVVIKKSNKKVTVPQVAHAKKGKAQDKKKEVKKEAKNRGRLEHSRILSSLFHVIGRYYYIARCV